MTRWSTGACLLAVVLAPAVGRAAAPADQAASGIDTFRTSCDGCHDLPNPENPRRTRAEWQTVMTKMVKEKGATLNEKEFAAVLDYLDSFNQPHRDTTWNDQPAASHRATFAGAQVGKLPEPWIAVAPGAGPAGPWTVQRDAGGTGFVLTPDRAAADGQQQIVIDNSGLVTAATIAARVRLPANGEGAGIVAGFRGPRAYYAARLSAATHDLVLYQVDQSDRALVGRAPAAVAAGAWVTLTVTLSRTQLQVALNGKPALTRPLTGYRGGRAGLLAEAGTVPAFDSWSVSVPK